MQMFYFLFKSVILAQEANKKSYTTLSVACHMQTH